MAIVVNTHCIAGAVERGKMETLLFFLESSCCGCGVTKINVEL